MCNQCAQQFTRADHLRRHTRHHAEQASRDEAAAATAGAAVDDGAVPLACSSDAVSSDDGRMDDVSLPYDDDQELVIDLSTAADRNINCLQASVDSSQHGDADECTAGYTHK